MRTHDSAPAAGSAGTVTTRYQVKGMTCAHCVNAVRAEVGRIPGVLGVDVDLSTGAVVVTGPGSADATAVREAVDEAGYEVVDR